MIHIVSFFTVALGDRYIPIYIIMLLILIYLGNKHKLLGPNMKSIAERIKSGDNGMTC
jgi:hypothetical protein